MISIEKMEQKKRMLGAVLTLFGGCGWGLSGSMGQFLFTREHMQVMWLVPIRLGLAGIILFLYCLRKERIALFAVWKQKKSAVTMLVYGLLGVSLCQFLYFLTIQQSSAGIGTILQELAPVMILGCSCIVAKRCPHRYEILCLLLATIGVSCIVTHGQIADLAVSPVALVAGISSAACVTVYNMLAKDLTKEYPVVVLQAWSFLMGGVVLFFAFRSWTISYIPSVTGIFGILFVVVVGNILAFTTYIQGVSYIGPAKGILFGFSEPICAALVSVCLLGSTFGGWDFIGFLLIFVMLGVISYHTREEGE